MIKFDTDEEVINALKAPFEKNEEKQLTIGKGKNLVYLSVESVRQRLEDVLGLNWNWETVSTVYSNFYKLPKKEKQPNGRWEIPLGATSTVMPCVIVTGKLTLIMPSGKIITREGNGGSSLDKGTGPGDPEKIAASDAFKRAAWFFGIGAYLRVAIDASAYLPPNGAGIKPNFNNNSTAPSFTTNANLSNPNIGGLIPG